MRSNKLINYFRIKFWILLYLFISNYSFSQEALTTDQGFLTNTFIIQKESKNYKLEITTPPGFDKSKKYKTVYYLDGWYLSELIVWTSASLHMGECVKDIVTIGISGQGNRQDFNTQRNFDFTPSPYNEEKTGYKLSSPDGVKIDSSNTGGADIFIGFLENEVFPFVEDKYPNLSQSKCLIGHSFGGLFGVYILQKRPDLFEKLIIISPSIIWNKSEILKKEYFDSLKYFEKNIDLHISYGSKESILSVGMARLDSTLSNIKNKKVNFEVKKYQNLTHQSVIQVSIYEGLLKFYKRQEWGCIE
jgi:predicted alpha/beta superfamily hydrolase